MTSAAHSMQRHNAVRAQFSRLLRNLFGFLLGLALAAFVCFASADMNGLLYNHRCYTDPADLLNSFRMDFQSVVTNANYELCTGTMSPQMVANASYTNQSAAFAIQYYFVTESAAGVDSCATSSKRMIGLPYCDPDRQSLFSTSTNALFIVLGFFYAAMLGFKTGYRP